MRDIEELSKKIELDADALFGDNWKNKLAYCVGYIDGVKYADDNPVTYDGKAMLYVCEKSHQNGYAEAVVKACEWLRNNWHKYINIDADGVVCFGHWENDFRKAMKGE